MGGILAAICLMLSSIILSDPDSSIALFLALTVGFFILKRPIVGILVVLISTSTIISPMVLPKLNLFGADVQFTEIVILLTTLIIVLNHGIIASLRRIFSSRLLLLLMVFLALIVTSVIHSLSLYTDLEITTVIARSRTFFYYLLVFPVFLALRKEDDVRFLVNGLLVISGLVAVYFIYTAVFGQTYLHYLLRTGIRFEVHNVVAGDTSGGLLRNARIRDVPGMALIVSMFFISICLFIFLYSTRRYFRYGALTILMTIPILLSFTRTTWATTLFMFPLLWIITRKKSFRLTKLTAIMMGGFLVAFLALALHPKYSNIISLTVDRFKSFFVENVEAGTAVWRIVEMKAAMDEIHDNPWMGIGVAGEIVEKKVEYEGKDYLLVHNMGIHDAYLTMALKAGIPSLVVLLIIFFLTLGRAWKVFKVTESDYFKGVSLGLFIGLIRILLNAFSQPYFVEVPMVPCLAVLIALIESMRDITVRHVGKGIATGKDLVPLQSGQLEKYR